MDDKSFIIGSVITLFIVFFFLSLDYWLFKRFLKVKPVPPTVEPAKVEHKKKFFNFQKKEKDVKTYDEDGREVSPYSQQSQNVKPSSATRPVDLNSDTTATLRNEYLEPDLKPVILETPEPYEPDEEKKDVVRNTITKRKRGRPSKQV